MSQSLVSASLQSISGLDVAVLWLKIMATGVSVALFLSVAAFALAAVVQRSGYGWLAAQFTLANLFAALYIGSDAAVRFDVLTGDLSSTLTWYRLALSAIYLSLASYISLYWTLDRRHRARPWLLPALWALAGVAVGLIWWEHPALIIASDALTVRDLSVFADYGAAAPWFFALGLLLFLGFCVGVGRVAFARLPPPGRALNMTGFGLLLATGLHDVLREFGVYLLPFSTIGLGYMCFQIGAIAFVGLHYARTLREQGQQRRRIEQLSEAVARDRLSGLYARRHLEQRLDEGGAPAEGLLFLDLDDFKSINDRYGHAAGDAAIAAVGEVLADNLRAGDMACRWGGDEFLVLLGQADDARASALAVRLGEAVRGVRLAQAPGLQLGVSMGFALLEDGDWRVSLSRADQALYQAKQAGKGRAVHAAGPELPPGAAAPKTSVITN